MALKQLNDTITGFPKRCYMIFSDTSYSKKIREIWTEVSNGRGGYFEKWGDDPIINREVASFQASGSIKYILCCTKINFYFLV